MKEIKTSPSTSPQNAAPATNNPFLTSQPVTTQVDLFGAPNPEASSLTGKASDDLLNLSGNPFVENVRSVMSMNNTVTAMSTQNAFSTPAWGSTNGKFCHPFPVSFSMLPKPIRYDMYILFALYHVLFRSPQVISKLFDFENMIPFFIQSSSLVTVQI